MDLFVVMEGVPESESGNMYSTGMDFGERDPVVTLE